MPRKTSASKPGPQKGHVPDFSGVPGELVDAAVVPADVIWGHKARKSPYDPLLLQLAEAGAGKVLRFSEPKAKSSIPARAKKLGLRVTCGEAGGGALFVRFDGRVEDDKRETRREILKGALKVTVGASVMALTQVLRDKGDTTVDANIVGAILMQMLKAGEVIQQEGGTWRLNPARRTA
jgi:hypothetical protein